MHNGKETLLKHDGKLAERDQEWVDLLCKYGNMIEYEEILGKSRNAMFAIMEYRRLLRLRGIGNIQFIMLNTAYTKKDYNKLHSLLQELFLEAISNAQFNYILEKINSVNNGLLKLYTQHMNYLNKRISTVILTL